MATTNKPAEYCCSECGAKVQGDAVTVADCPAHPLAVIVPCAPSCEWCGGPATRSDTGGGNDGTRYACDRCPERNCYGDYLNVRDPDESYADFERAYLSIWEPIKATCAPSCEWCGEQATRQNNQTGEYACGKCPEANCHGDYLNVGETDTYEEFRAAYLAVWEPIATDPDTCPTCNKPTDSRGDL